MYNFLYIFQVNTSLDDPSDTGTPPPSYEEVMAGSFPNIRMGANDEYTDQRHETAGLHRTRIYNGITNDELGSYEYQTQHCHDLKTGLNKIK